MALAAETVPDLIVMNSDLGDGLEGAELVRALKAVCPDARVLAMATAEHALAQRETCMAGADAVLGKSTPTAMFLKVLQTLAGGDFTRPILFPPCDHCEDGLPGELPMLSQRERQVLELIAAGLHVREIAARLGISRKTVESHRCNIRAKLDLPDVDSLREFARAHFGIILPGDGS